MATSLSKHMNNGFQHTEEAIKQRGEVFTPPKLVKQMLGKLPQSVFMDPKKTFLDNSCGNGQFLTADLKKKMSWAMNLSAFQIDLYHSMNGAI